VNPTPGWFPVACGEDFGEHASGGLTFAALGSRVPKRQLTSSGRVDANRVPAPAPRPAPAGTAHRHGVARYSRPAPERRPQRTCRPTGPSLPPLELRVIAAPPQKGDHNTHAGAGPCADESRWRPSASAPSAIGSRLSLCTDVWPGEFSTIPGAHLRGGAEYRHDPTTTAS